MHLACTIYSKENLVKESIKGTVSVISSVPPPCKEVANSDSQQYFFEHTMNETEIL